MKKRFWESDAAFKRRWDIDQAIRSLGVKKLWRVNAIEMRQGPMGSWIMGHQDHFTVEAHTLEQAIGKFKTMGKMNWFVVSVQDETVVG